MQKIFRILTKRNLVAVCTVSVAMVFFSCDLVDPVDKDTDGSGISKDAHEPNDQRSSATAVSLKGNIEGTIHSASDVDYYQFTTQNSDSWDWLQFDISDVAGFRATLTVYKDDGTEVFSVNGANRESNVVHTMSTTGGTYFARVSSFYSDESGSYTLAINNLDTNDTYEPNETRDAAYTLGALPAPSIHGRILSGSEEDWFTFTTINTEQWDWVAFNVTGVSEKIRPELTVYNSDGVEIFGVRGSDRGADFSHRMSTTGGTYFAKVNSFYLDGYGSYTLAIANLDTNDTYEPNETRGAAYSLGPVPISSIHGRILSGSEKDWYSFTATNDGIWDWTRFSVTDVTDGIRPTLTVYDSAGTELFNTKSANRGASISHRFVSRGGLYYAEISSFYSGEAGSYTLAIANLDTNDAFEPNDVLDNAHTIESIPSGTLNAAIVGHGDEDWFTCPIDAGETLLFSFENNSEKLRIVIDFYKADGDRIGGMNGGTTGADLAPTFTNSGQSSGTLYFKVSSFYSNGYGDYALSITAQ